MPCCFVSNQMSHVEIETTVVSMMIVIVFLCRRDRNRLMHAMTGNGKGAKGQAKGRGKHEVVVDPEVEFASAVRRALPEAAKVRMQPRLVQAEWDSPIRSWQDLGPSGGVAVVAKENLPLVLEKVGYSSRPTAALVTQDPDSLGLRGYPRSRVVCSLDVDAGAGERKIVLVDRFLVQLGFAGQVNMVREGEELEIGVTMTRMVAKFSTLRGWSLGPHPAGVLTEHLNRVVDAFSIDMVQSREDGSVVFYVNEMDVRKVLRYSGQSGVFLKRHQSEEHDGSMELFWLSEDCTLDQALEYAKDERARGLAEKGKNGRLAVRFDSEGDMAAFLKAMGLPAMDRLGRWKVTGIPLNAGLEGVYRLLVSLKWEVEEIVFHDERQCIFLAKNRGKDAPAHFMFQGTPRTIKFKALNAAARESVEIESKEQRKLGMGKGAARGSRQRVFLDSMAKARSEMEVDASQHPHTPVGAKRATEGNTGLTPEPQLRKTN